MNIINIKDKNLFYIGGVVRDELLGRQSLDVDITYVGNAIEFCSKFALLRHCEDCCENSSILMEIIQVNPDFGTVRVKIYPLPNFNHSHSDNGEILPSHNERGQSVEVDFASTRSESYPRKGHLPIVEEVGCSLKEDVLRRDFTINALAKNTLTGEIVDYTGGLDDLKNKKIRVLHDESFIDDPTRIIRGLKFSVRFGFELDEHTKLLQDEYLSAVNYDMSYKRVKKELIETFNPLPNFSLSHSDKGEIQPSHNERGLMCQLAFEKFVNEGIYKLLAEQEVVLPKVNIGKLINEYLTPHPNPLPQGAREDYVWLVYMGIFDLSRLPLTKIEQKILNDVPKRKFETDFELYKAFENARVETILLYAILQDEVGARRYLDELRNTKIAVTGKDLQTLGIPPSPKYQEFFDMLLKKKLANPTMTKEDEISCLKNIL